MASKRTRLTRPNEFVLLEAEERDAGGDSSDVDDGATDGFLSDNEIPDILSRGASYWDIGLEFDEESDGEQEVEEALARAKRRAADSRMRTDLEAEEAQIVPDEDMDDEFDENTRQLLSTPDLQIWELSVKRKSEIKLVKQLNLEYRLLKFRSEERTENRGSPLDDNLTQTKPLFAFEAFSIKGLRRRVFVATNDLKAAAKKLSGYIADKTVFNYCALVDCPKDYLLGSEVVSYLANKLKHDIHHGQWVRITTGLYRGDLAMILELVGPNIVEILTVPRFDQLAYIEREMKESLDAQPTPKLAAAKASGQKRKRGRTTPCLLHEDIMHHMVEGGIGVHGVAVIYNNERVFIHRLELLRFKLDQLELHPVIRDEDIQPFTDVRLCNQATSEYIRHRRRDSWRQGDQAYILRGEYAGLIGILLDYNAHDHAVTVQFDPVEDDVPERDSVVTLEWDDVRRHFPVGTWVRVAWGEHKDRTGVVVEETNRDRGFVKVFSYTEFNKWKMNEDRERERDEEWRRREGKQKQKEDIQEEVKEDIQGEVKEDIQEEVNAMRMAANEKYISQSKHEIGYEFDTKQDFLEEYSDPVSFDGVRNPHAPGTVDSSFVCYAQEQEEKDPTRIKQKELEADFRYYPQPHGRGALTPALIQRELRVLVTHESLEEKVYMEATPRRDCSRDWRIGKEACIIGKTPWKGVTGYIEEISRGRVRIRFPTQRAGAPHATVKLSEAVCLSRPYQNMAKEKLNAPITVLTAAPASSPPRPSTPDLLLESGDLEQVDLAEGAFLTDSAIGVCSSCHIGVKFQLSFEQGSWEKRVAWTDKKPMLHSTESAFDIKHGPLITVTTTHHKTGEKIRKEVAIGHLAPALPTKKDEEVMILKRGPLYGQCGKVLKFRRKEGTADVDIDGTKETFPSSDLCRITTKEPYT